jgi:hypothetical protein
LVFWEAYLVDSVPPLFVRLAPSIVRFQEFLLFGSETPDLLCGLHVTSRRHPSMVRKVIFSLEGSIASATVFWRMALVDVIPNNLLAKIRLEEHNFLT